MVFRHGKQSQSISTFFCLKKQLKQKTTILNKPNLKGTMKYNITETIVFSNQRYADHQKASTIAIKAYWLQTENNPALNSDKEKDKGNNSRNIPFQLLSWISDYILFRFSPFKYYSNFTQYYNFTVSICSLNIGFCVYIMLYIIILCINTLLYPQRIQCIYSILKQIIYLLRGY